MFGAGLKPRLFLFHLLIQTVSNTPHTVPVMNITSEEVTAVMATVAAVDSDGAVVASGVVAWVMMAGEYIIIM